MKKQVVSSIIALSLGLFPFQPLQAAWDRPTIAAVSDGLDAFWGEVLRRLGVKYRYPLVYSHRNIQSTPCGPAMLAHYSANSNTIHLNMAQMDRLVGQVGDSAGYFALAHEYGHSVQRHLGILNKNLPIVKIELQADFEWSPVWKSRGQRSVRRAGQAIREIGSLDIAYRAIERLG